MKSLKVFYSNNFIANLIQVATQNLSSKMSLDKSDSDDESLPDIKDIVKSFYESKASNKPTYASTSSTISN
jgi:hypothetical protein